MSSSWPLEPTAAFQLSLKLCGPLFLDSRDPCSLPSLPCATYPLQSWHLPLPFHCLSPGVPDTSSLHISPGWPGKQWEWGQASPRWLGWNCSCPSSLHQQCEPVPRALLTLHSLIHSNTHASVFGVQGVQ